MLHNERFIFRPDTAVWQKLLPRVCLGGVSLKHIKSNEFATADIGQGLCGVRHELQQKLDHYSITGWPRQACFTSEELGRPGKGLFGRILKSNLRLYENNHTVNESLSLEWSDLVGDEHLLDLYFEEEWL